MPTAAQNIANRLIGNLVAQIGQSSGNPVIAPGPVLLGHANDRVLHVFDDWRPARATRSDTMLVAAITR
jgi:hypothetical protein